MTKEGAIPREHPAEFYDGPGDHDHHPPVDTVTTDAALVVENGDAASFASTAAATPSVDSQEQVTPSDESSMEVVSREDVNDEMNLDTVE